VVSFTPRLLYLQRKSLWYPLDRRLGEPQSRAGRGGEEKNSQPLLGLEPPIMQPVLIAILTIKFYMLYGSLISLIQNVRPVVLLQYLFRGLKTPTEFHDSQSISSELLEITHTHIFADRTQSPCCFSFGSQSKIL
jgi:hypothetical protein